MNTHALTWPNTAVASSAYTLLCTQSKHWLCCVVFCFFFSFPHTAKKKSLLHTHRKDIWQPSPPNTHYFIICWLDIHAHTGSWPNIISAGIFWKFQWINQLHVGTRKHTESQPRPDTSKGSQEFYFVEIVWYMGFIISYLYKNILCLIHIQFLC